MGVGEDFGKVAAQTIADALKEALGRDLQDAEKLAAVLVQGAADHLLAGVASLVEGKRIVISIEDKPQK